MKSAAVLRVDGNQVHPTAHASGPWREDAQHGGAPAALFAATAETVVAAVDGEWQLLRLSVELLRPVPVAALRIEHLLSGGRTVKRVDMRLYAQDTTVATAVALMQQPAAKPLPQVSAEEAPAPLPAPDQCHETVHITGMPLRDGFHCTALEILLAAGSVNAPGPASAWFRPTMPLIAGRANSPAMRSCAAADFGNGLSWVLPFDRFLYTNSDLHVFLQRPPQGEWVGVQAQTTIEPSGIGASRSQLWDVHGVIGHAHQNLVVRPR